MKFRHLVDTDWAIHWLRGHDPIRSRLSELRAEGLALSIISLAELYEGVFGSSDPAESEIGVRAFAEGVTILSIDDETCRVFARERARLRRVGRHIGDFDLMIGATALRHNLDVLTNNRRHFELIEGLILESA